MKKLKFFSLALVALTLGACSSDDVVDPGKDQPGFNSEGTGYINLTIDLPTRSVAVSRAANDQTADGTANEYKVNNATLILFKGSTPNTATFAGAYSMNLTWNDGADNDQISTQASTVQKINSVTTSTGEDVYALVVLNNNELLTVNKDDNSLKVNNTGFTGTFAQFTNLTASNITSFTGASNNSFYMSNAVVTNMPGSAALTGAKTTILVPVSDKIYPTEAEAKQNPAADIMVERGVAKVELTNTSSGKLADVVVEGEEEAGISYEIAGWALANKNTSSYLVRNWDQNVSGIDVNGDDWYDLASNGDGLTAPAANPYRFAGTTLIKEDPGNPAANFYRTYWGIDPNYNTQGNFSDAPSNAEGMTFDDKIKYCFENTFDVSRQNVNNTTCVIVKAQYKLPEDWNGTFYILNGDRTHIYSEKQSENAVLAKAVELFQSAAMEYVNVTARPEGVDGTAHVTATSLTKDFVKEDATSGALTITGVTFTGTYENSEETVTYTLTKDQLATLNSNIAVTQYTNGWAYYPVLIKHFGDELTPWNRATKTTEAYPSGDDQDANWLGRYGVLRNNWYVVNVTKVTGIGSATVPDVNDDPRPDDDIVSYLSVNINVLSWAKRTQDVEL